MQLTLFYLRMRFTPDLLTVRTALVFQTSASTSKRTKTIIDLSAPYFHIFHLRFATRSFSHDHIFEKHFNIADTPHNLSTYTCEISYKQTESNIHIHLPPTLS